MDNGLVYDTYIKVVPPLKRVGSVLLKMLEFFSWKYVGIIGGGADSNTWDKVDALWKSVEQQLQAEITVTSSIKFDIGDPELTHKNMKRISKVARGRNDFLLFLLSDHFFMVQVDLGDSRDQSMIRQQHP